MKPLSGRLYLVAAPEAQGAPVQFYSALHGLLRPALRRMTEGQPWISLELGGSDGRVRFYIWIPLGQEPFVEDLLRAGHPGIEFTPVAEDPLTAVESWTPVAFSPVTLARSVYLPIKTTSDGDMLASLLATLARPGADERIHITLLVRPRANGWQTTARGQAHRLRKGARNLLVEALLPTPKMKTAPTAHQLERAKQMDEKAHDLGFDCAMRVVAVGRDEAAAREYLRAVAGALRVFDGANGFAFPRVWKRGRFVKELRTRRFPTRGSFILTSNELAAIWHLPSEALPHVEAVRSPRLPAPPEVARDGRMLGVAHVRGGERPIALDVEAAMHHLAILGSTGTGKTSLSIRLAVEDIEAGRGVIAISGKADLLKGIQARIPRRRIQDVVLIQADDSASVGLNPLEYGPGDDTELLADNLLTILRRQFERFWGPRTTQLLNACLKTLLARPDSTIDQIPMLLFDEEFRRNTLEAFAHVPPVLATYWRWYDGLSQSHRNEVTAPLLNKLDHILMRDRARRLLTQRRSTIDLEAIMEGRKVLLADLSTGVWGDETSTLAGSFLIAKLWQIRRRVAARKMPEDCFVYIDEAQQFANISDDLAGLLDQARGYRLALTLANQHLGQLPREFRDALSSNARSKVVFACGQEDARYLARELSPLDADALMALPRYRVAARLMAEGQASRAFTFVTLPPPPVADPNVAVEVAAASRTRYARPNGEIDAEARARHEPTAPDTPSHGVGRRPRT